MGRYWDIQVRRVVMKHLLTGEHWRSAPGSGGCCICLLGLPLSVSCWPWRYSGIVKP
jgi:hypothetical protein